MNQNENEERQGQHGGDHGRGMYLRFGAMILTAMVVMYWVMFVSSWEWSHVRFSMSRVFMALTMGGAMVLVMLAWMLNMYKNTKVNVAIVLAGILLLGLGTYLDRQQLTVGNNDFMRAMIPHHSLAITRAERSHLDDVRVCELAVEISEAQRKEIREMDWLIGDIRENGPATTTDAARSRPVPEFEGNAARTC